MDRKQFDEKIENFIEFLEEALPNADSVHRSEILDIADLLKARAEKFVNNYGLN